jgi:acetyl-CoA carboxylase biotin carboxyl carrier protein
MSFNSTVESLSKIMDNMGINELELERQFLFGVYRKHIHLSKGQTVAVAAPVVQNTVARTEFQPEVKSAKVEIVETKIANLPTLNSPMVGVAYMSPEPGAKPFVSVGSTVKSGDTVALIEAMKTFNPIKSNKDGVIKEILVKDGEAVEFDQPIIVIE